MLKGCNNALKQVQNNKIKVADAKKRVEAKKLTQQTDTEMLEISKEKLDTADQEVLNGLQQAVPCNKPVFYKLEKAEHMYYFES